MLPDYHIGIVSAFFDARPEGICTGRLVRALLEHGFRITLFTSSKAKVGFSHENLQVKIYRTGIREPRGAINWVANRLGHVPNNYYFWGRRVLKEELVEEEVPDLFYGRAWPHASLVPACSLADKYCRPLMLHFSDPFPPPNESLPKQSFMAGVQSMVDQADVLTFTNAQTIAYQARYLDTSRTKNHVMPHVSLESTVLRDVKRRNQYYLIGSMGVHRPADLLLEGFKRFQEQNEGAHLYFVGASSRYLSPLLDKYGVKHCVSILPFTQNVMARMEDASTLVSFDAEVEEPIFTPTKIIEYLNVNRPVLAVTPLGSPVNELLNRFSDSTVSVTEYGVDSIAKGFEAAAALKPDEETFKARFKFMNSEFGAGGIAKRFLAIVEEVIGGYDSKKSIKDSPSY